MARSKSLPRKTVHPNKLFKKNYKSKYNLNDSDNENIFKSTIFVLIFLFFFIKYEIYKFDNLKYLFVEYIHKYLEHLTITNISTIFIIILLLFPDFIFTLFDKFILLALKFLLILEFILSVFEY